MEDSITGRRQDAIDRGQEPEFFRDSLGALFEQELDLFFQRQAAGAVDGMKQGFAAGARVAALIVGPGGMIVDAGLLVRIVGQLQGIAEKLKGPYRPVVMQGNDPLQVEFSGRIRKSLSEFLRPVVLIRFAGQEKSVTVKDRFPIQVALRKPLQGKFVGFPCRIEVENRFEDFGLLTIKDAFSRRVKDRFPVELDRGRVVLEEGLLSRLFVQVLRTIRVGRGKARTPNQEKKDRKKP